MHKKSGVLRLRESFGVLVPLGGRLLVIRSSCTRRDVSETRLHMFLPNRPRPVAGRPRSRKVHQPKRPPLHRGHSRRCRVTALKSQAQRTHELSNTDERTTRASPHCFPKETREYSEDNVVSNGDGFRSGSPIQQSVHTRWSRHPYYHSLEIPYVY